MDFVFAMILATQIPTDLSRLPGMEADKVGQRQINRADYDSLRLGMPLESVMKVLGPVTTSDRLPKFIEFDLRDTVRQKPGLSYIWSSDRFRITVLVNSNKRVVYLGYVGLQ